MRLPARAAQRSVGILIAAAGPLAAQQPAAPAADPPLPPAAQRWVATEGVASPWIFDFIVNDTALAGAARQRGFPPRSTFSAPFEIHDGRIHGDTLSFKLIANDGDRIISFKGVRSGDTIAFTRSALMIGGMAVGNGIIGPDGATAFAAWRLPSGTAIPISTRVNLRQLSVDSARDKVAYKGFTLVLDPIAAGPSHDSAVAAVEHQLDLVDQVVPADALRRLHDIPLIVYKGDGSPMYFPPNKRVLVPADAANAPLDAAHPVLLHELCHGYEDLVLPQGFKNPDVLSLYAQAKASGKFPADAYMLSNPGEYFAMMTTAYLAGSEQREPFARDSIRVKQPEMYQWLQKQFGDSKR